MKLLLLFWGAPLGFFWGWYFLSLYDINMGTMFLSRDLHDLVFQVYGEILGVDPAAVPAMVAKACMVDTLIVLGLYALRRRRDLWAAFTRLRAALSVPVAVREADPVPPAE